MNIQIKGTRYEPTPEMETQAREKVAALARFIDETDSGADAAIELERAVGSHRSGDVWRAELQVSHAGRSYRAESTKAKLDHALTTVVRDMGEMLRKAHRKDTDKIQKGGGMLKSFLRGFER